MTDITDTLRTCHAIVWTARAELKDVWPTPSTHDALLFAFTELGEAIDAHLRGKAVYARNRDKDLSVLDELADCAMMLLTAIKPHNGDGGLEDVIDNWGIFDFHDKWFGRHDWSIYAMDLAEIVYWEDHGDLSTECWVLRPVYRIATHPGMDLPARLTARLDRIRAKRLPLATIAISDAYEQRKVAHESEAP